jgi:hypothetical protein
MRFLMRQRLHALLASLVPAPMYSTFLAAVKACGAPIVERTGHSRAVLCCVQV